MRFEIGQTNYLLTYVPLLTWYVAAKPFCPLEFMTLLSLLRSP